MHLKTLVEGLTQFPLNQTRAQRIESARKKIFDFDYPLSDSVLRREFETNFIMKFYMREIGFETEEQFLMQLETWLRINMEYFDNLFKSETIKFDPLKNVMLKTIHDKNNDNTRNDATQQKGYSKGNQAESTKLDQTSKNRDFNRQLHADVADNRLAITTDDGSGVIEYASTIDESLTTNEASATNDGLNIRDNTVNSTADAESTSFIKLVETYSETQEGKTGADTYSKMLTEYRGTFLRLQKQIFEEMNHLFMGIY